MALLRSWLLGVVGLLALSLPFPIAGCGQGNIKRSLDLRSRGDADLVALLPRPLDAVLDVDLSGPTGLKQLASLDELLALLPSGVITSLEQLCDHPTLSLEAVAVGISGMGTPSPEIAVLVRGDLQKERIFAAVRRRAGQAASTVQYHGVPLVEASPSGAQSGAADAGPADGGADSSLGQYAAIDPAHSAAAAMLTPRTVVFGSRLSTRQVVDIFRGEEEGVRAQADLMNALARAPRAKTGRPAVLLASLLAPAVRERLSAFGVPELAEHGDFLSVALAVGDGIDVGIVVGYRTQEAATRAVRGLQERTAELRRRPVLAFIGLASYLEPLQLVAAPKNARRAQPELHVAYRLPGDELGQLIKQVARLKQLDLKAPGSPAAP